MLIMSCRIYIPNEYTFTCIHADHELSGEEREALDIVPVITTALLEEQQLVTGIVVVVDPGTIPINSRGEKQRIHLRDSFLADEVDPIYVAYIKLVRSTHAAMADEHA